MTSIFAEANPGHPAFASRGLQPAPTALHHSRCFFRFLRIHSLFASCTSNAGSPVFQSLMAASPAAVWARLRDYPGPWVLMTLVLHPLGGALKSFAARYAWAATYKSLES